MKKFLVLLIFMLVLSVSFVSCSGDSDGADDVPSDENDAEHSHTLDEYGVCTSCGQQASDGEGSGGNKPEHSHTLDQFGWCTDCGEPVLATEGISYELSEDGTYAIATGYSGTSEKVIVASEYNGVPVTSIAPNAFRASTFTTVVIPDSVTIIGERAFEGCRELTSVTLSDNLTEISEGVFYSCEKLKDVKIPQSVTTIREEAFAYCPGPKVLVIPYGVRDIRDRAFFYCTEIRSVVMADSVSFIDTDAFAECNMLIRVYYKGTETDRNKMVIYSSKIGLATWYYYSEKAPETAGRYWHYDENGEIVFW